VAGPQEKVNRESKRILLQKDNIRKHSYYVLLYPENLNGLWEQPFYIRCTFLGDLTKVFIVCQLITQSGDNDGQ